MAKEIFLSLAIQILLTIVPVFVFGLLIRLINRSFYSHFGRYQMSVCYLTGFLGTPVHELSHALMCIIFFHKITEIKLFQIDSEDGTLGYVMHSYNKRNIYQNLGNYFIGIAPIIVIAALLYLFAYLLIPDMVYSLNAVNGVVGSEMLESIKDVFICIGSLITTWKFWVFVLISSFFALHMTLSKEDVKGSLSGLIILIILMLIVDVILGLTGVLSGYNSVFMALSIYLLLMLCLSLFISLILWILSFVFHALFKKYL